MTAGRWKAYFCEVRGALLVLYRRGLRMCLKALSTNVTGPEWALYGLIGPKGSLFKPEPARV